MLYGVLLLVAVWNVLVVSPWVLLLVLWFGILIAYSLFASPRAEARWTNLERALAEATAERA